MIKLTENEMEQYLTNKGYDIMDRTILNDTTIDSTKVCDYAADLGYNATINDKTGIIIFESTKVSLNEVIKYLNKPIQMTIEMI